MQIQFNNVHAQVLIEESEVAAWENARLEFKVKAPGAFYIPNHKTWIKTKGKSGWDGKVNLVKNTGTLPTGLVPRLVKVLNKYKISPEIIDKRNIPTIILDQPEVKLRDYQVKAVTTSLSSMFSNVWWPRGVIKVGTGGGKTELAVCLYQYNPKPSLFLVHRKDLLYQTAERFKKYGVPTGIVGDGIYDVREDGITVSTIQTLNSLLRNKSYKLGWLNKIQQTFFDEAHLMAATLDKGNSFIQVASLLTNSYMRWGLTATPFMKDVYSDLLLEGACGDTLYTISSAELIAKGWLTKAKVTILPVPKTPSRGKWPDCYQDGVILNDVRNDLIIDQIEKLPKPLFVMCNRKQHAEILSRKAAKRKIPLPILSGSDSVTTRQRTLKRLAEGDLDQIICTTIFDEGLDLPELKSIILGGGGVSKIKQLQRIGRGLRLDPSKDIFHLIDFKDTAAPILVKHSKERRKTWIEEGYTLDE